MFFERYKVRNNCGTPDPERRASLSDPLHLHMGAGRAEINVTFYRG